MIDNYVYVVLLYSILKSGTSVVTTEVPVNTLVLLQLLQAITKAHFDDYFVLRCLLSNLKRSKRVLQAICVFQKRDIWGFH